MRPYDQPRFQSTMASLAEVFAKQLSPQLVDLYWDALGKITIEQFQASAKAWIKTGKNFPKPGDLLGFAALAAPPSQVQSFATVQEQLCEYASGHVHDLAGPGERMTLLQYSRPWTYVYREWVAEGKRQAECVGLVIELDDGKRLGWSVKAMLEDTEGYERMRRTFTTAGPMPSEAQIQAHRKAMATINERVTR